MCGRFTLTAEVGEIKERFDIRNTFDYIARYNIAPSQEVLAVIQDGDGERVGNRAGYLRWGLIPSWAKDPAIGNRMINARAETIAEKASFKHAFLHRRCLIIADGFYEWKKENGQKIPLRIRMKDGGLFAMAGLWDRWTSPDGKAVTTCTIITVPPNPLMQTIHDRMPAILTKEHEQVWLDRSQRDPHQLHHVLTPYPLENMEAYQVSLLVNSPKNDTPDCLNPANIS